MGVRVVRNIGPAKYRSTAIYELGESNWMLVSDTDADYLVAAFPNTILSNGSITPTIIFTMAGYSGGTGVTIGLADTIAAYSGFTLYSSFRNATGLPSQL